MPIVRPSIVKPNSREAQTAQHLFDSLKGQSNDSASLCLDNDVSLDIPEFALRLLIEIFREVAKGNAVTLIPVHSELTTQQAADILNVSRPYVVKLLENQKIPHIKRGRHRRIRFEDLMSYKEKDDHEREQALDEMVRLSEDLGVGYE